MSQEKYLDLADSTFARGVVLIDSTTGLPINSEGVDRELVVTTYFVKTAFTGASLNDTITATQVIDVSATPTTVSTVWRNQTTAADLASAPSAANLTLLGSQALSDAQLRATAVPVSGTLTKTPATTGAQTIVVSSAADGTILASNASRKGAVIYNDSTAALYLLLANTTSSATVFTVKVAAAGTFTLENGDYTGIIKGIWASANGNARVTELV